MSSMQASVEAVRKSLVVNCWARRDSYEPRGPF
jgi:hypothetical protein